MAVVPAPLGELSAEFEALYHAHFEFVWRTLRRFGVPSGALDDATQDVFVIAHRRFGAWEGRASARAWLFGVAKRVASRHRRGRERHERKIAALPPPAGDRSLDEHVAERDRIARIGRAIDALTPERREVFVLADLEGLSAPEIAEALHIKLNTVYSRLRRARADLETSLATTRDHVAVVSATDPPTMLTRRAIERRPRHDRTG